MGTPLVVAESQRGVGQEWPTYGATLASSAVLFAAGVRDGNGTQNPVLRKTLPMSHCKEER
jgi:hypothetical protein